MKYLFLTLMLTSCIQVPLNPNKPVVEYQCEQLKSGVLYCFPVGVR